MSAKPDKPESRLPRHVAVIMDGNGRWANRRGKPRFAGHRAGVKTARTIVEWAHDRDIVVSVDVSSVTLIDEVGSDAMLDLLVVLRPAVVFANADEAAALGIVGQIANAVTVIRNGPAPAVVHADLDRYEVPADAIDGVEDTTGAGDAFNSGFLTADWRRDVEAACRSGHRTAADALSNRG